MKKPAKATPVEVAKAAVKRVIRVRPKPVAPADAPRRPAPQDATRVPDESRF